MKIIWITGGSSGIGFATAKKFLKNNWKVIISARNHDKLLKAKDEILKYSQNQHLYIYKCDISNQSIVAETVEKIIKDIGMIDLAILNAAAYSPNKSQEFLIENYEHLIKVNLNGTLYCIENLIKKLSDKKSHIALV